jgi:hypothetical protein
MEKRGKGKTAHRFFDWKRSYSATLDVEYVVRLGRNRGGYPTFVTFTQLSKKLEVPLLRLDLPVVTFPCASCDCTLQPSGSSFYPFSSFS